MDDVKAALCPGPRSGREVMVDLRVWRKQATRAERPCATNQAMDSDTDLLERVPSWLYSITVGMSDRRH